MAIMNADLMKKDQATFLEVMHLKKKALGYYNPEKISVLISYRAPSSLVTACARSQRFAPCAGTAAAGSARN